MHCGAERPGADAVGGGGGGRAWGGAGEVGVLRGQQAWSQRGAHSAQRSVFFLGQPHERNTALADAAIYCHVLCVSDSVCMSLITSHSPSVPASVSLPVSSSYSSMMNSLNRKVYIEVCPSGEVIPRIVPFCYLVHCYQSQSFSPSIPHPSVP